MLLLLLIHGHFESLELKFRLLLYCILKETFGKPPLLGKDQKGLNEER